MKTVAKVLLIVGLALGLLGGLSRILPLFYGDTMLQALKGSPTQMQGNVLLAQEGIKQASARTVSNILAISGNLALVLAGGTFGLLALASGTAKVWRIVFSIVALASGLGLIAMRSWICAGAYMIAGFVLLMTSDSKSGAPVEPDSSHESD
jgi:hypothetical protein